jgi:hypothetical protein
MFLILKCQQGRNSQTVVACSRDVTLIRITKQNYQINV